jgi:electron transfer flavoprotein beta subunit
MADNNIQKKLCKKQICNNIIMVSVSTVLKNDAKKALRVLFYCYICGRRVDSYRFIPATVKETRKDKTINNRSMKILVCISNVPDTTTKIKFQEGNTRLDTAGIQWVINPWDELSLTRALELRDDASTGVKSITVAHVGGPGSEPTIRKALAIGADDAIRVNAEADDAYYVAWQLAAAIKKEQFDIIICGIESSDFNGSLVGGMIAELLDIPSVSAVSSIKIEGGIPVLTREIDGGRETINVQTPFVAIVQKGITKEPRIAAMRGIMMARTKPIKVYEAEQCDKFTEIVSFEKPAARAACKFVDAENPKQLVELLQNEAKVI